MKKRPGFMILLILFAYAALILLLTFAEQNAPGASIHSVGDALWYSLVTLTTVGYGDLFPVSPLGRAIGLLFVLLSAGLLAAALGIMGALIRGSLAPRFRAMRLRGKACFFFSDCGEAAQALARDLLSSDPNAAAVFCRAFHARPLPSRRALYVNENIQDALLSAPFSRGGEAAFLFSADMDQNAADARALLPRGIPLYCRGAEDASLPAVRFLDDAVCCARAYWRDHPILPGEKDVVLIGGGKIAMALLDQAAVINCRTPLLFTRYHLFGDWAAWRRIHPALCRALAGDKEAEKDALIFHTGPWEECPGLIERAQRVIICLDDPACCAREARMMERYFVRLGPVHFYAPQGGVPGGFGAAPQLFTRETVLQNSLDELARALHSRYCRENGADTPWEALSPFLKASNRAAADHLAVKMRLLLPEADDPAPTRENLREAFRRWQEAADKTAFRQCEHDRWMRFHLLYNWRPSPEKSEERRTHPCLVPFERLSDADKIKDDAAWAQLQSTLS